MIDCIQPQLRGRSIFNRSIDTAQEGCDCQAPDVFVKESIASGCFQILLAALLPSIRVSFVLSFFLHFQQSLLLFVFFSSIICLKQNVIVMNSQFFELQLLPQSWEICFAAWLLVRLSMAFLSWRGLSWRASWRRFAFMSVVLVLFHVHVTFLL